MDTGEILEAVAAFLNVLGYRKNDETKFHAQDVQSTIEELADELERSPEAAIVGLGGLSVNREEGQENTFVMRVALFDVEVERSAPEGTVLLTALRVKQPGMGPEE